MEKYARTNGEAPRLSQSGSQQRFPTRLLLTPLLALMLVVAWPGIVTAQIEVDRPRVGVVPFDNATGQSRNDAIAQTTSDTVLLTLRLVDAYELLEIDDQAITSELLLNLESRGLDARADELDVDNLMYGAVTQLDDGSLQFELRVFDRAEAEVTVEVTEVAESLFDVFDAADLLVAEAVGGFSGQRIGFGSLQIQPANDGDFRLYIDGSLLGENVTNLDRVLIGDRSITITETRGEREIPLYQEQFFLEEGERKLVEFEFPVVTEEERAREAELNRVVTDNVGLAINLSEVRSAIDELSALYERLPGQFGTAPSVLPLYEARLDMAQDIDRIVATDYREIAALDGTERRQAIIDLVQPWAEVYLDFSRRDELEWARAELERLRDDVRRNVSIMSDLLELNRVALVDEVLTSESPDLPPTTAMNRLRAMKIAYRGEVTFNGRPIVPLYDQRGGVVMNESVENYQDADARRRPFWHWLAWIGGAASAGTSAYIQFAGLLPDAEEGVNSALAAYNDASSVEAATSARAELDSALLNLNILEAASLGGYALGGLLVSAGTIGRATSVGRPERIWNDYLDDPYIEERRQVARVVRERLWEQGETGVLVLGDDVEFRSSLGRDDVTTPHYISTRPGTEFELEINDRSLDLEELRFTVREGLNVVVLEDLR